MKKSELINRTYDFILNNGTYKGKYTTIQDNGSIVYIYNNIKNKKLMNELAEWFLNYPNYKKIIDIKGFKNNYLIRILKKYFTIELLRVIFNYL